MNATASIAMILSNIPSSATSSSIHGSERLPEIAKSLAPYVQWTLEKFRHEDELWLDLFTGLVVLGVALEVVEIIHELREKFGPFKIHRPDKRWIPVVGFIGWLIVVIGVAGELVFESKLNTKNEMLEGISSALLADAQLSAANASALAGLADKGTIQLGIELGHAKAETATAELATEQERLARVKIESAVAFRQLTDPQKKEIGNAVAQFKSEAAASLWFPAGDIEAELFADDIAEALRVGGIIVQPPAGMVTMRGSGKFNDPIARADAGVVVQSTKVGDSPQFALAVIDELNKRGFDARRQTDPPFDNQSFTEIWINVEARPRGTQGEYKLQALQDAKKTSTAKSAK